MHPECTKVQFAGQHVYVGIDVAKKSWKVCIYLGDGYHKRFAQPPEPEALVEYLHRNFPGAAFHSVYEAGYFGFWIQRQLIRLGVDSMVTNPADVPTTDKERYTKTDHVDAAKLARALSNGQLAPKIRSRRSSSFMGIGYRRALLKVTGRAPISDGWRASRLMRRAGVRPSKHFSGSLWPCAPRLPI